MGVGKNASRQEKSEAMKHMDEKIAANPSGILMYHAPGRPFTFGKALGIEFATQLLEAILVVFLLAQTRIESFGWPGRLRFRNRDPGRDCHQRFLLELVRLSHRLYRQLYADPDRWLFRSGTRRRAGFAQAGFRCLTLKTVGLLGAEIGTVKIGSYRSPCVSLPPSSRTVSARRPLAVPYVASALLSLLLKRLSFDVLTGIHVPPAAFCFRNFAISFSDKSVPFI